MFRKSFFSLSLCFFTSVCGAEPQRLYTAMIDKLDSIQASIKNSKEACHEKSFDNCSTYIDLAAQYELTYQWILSHGESFEHEYESAVLHNADTNRLQNICNNYIAEVINLDVMLLKATLESGASISD